MYQEIKDLFVAGSCFFLLEEFSQYFLNFCQNINYSKPVRATAERYYRYRDLAIREVAANGENLDMFIKGLQDEKDNRLELFQQWTEKYFGFFVLIQSSEGHVSLKIQEKNSEQPINLADTGFGFSQILPIITQLWWLLYKNTKNNDRDNPIIFAIEQPELHLHPKLQALLADAFIAAVDEAKQKKINLKLIIETHSETMINRLGNRIANGDLNHDDINVVIFDRETNQKSATVQIAKYDQEGFLDNWPIGFFEPDIIKNS
jgi:predicted ATPase